MKLLACGGRDYCDRQAAFAALDAVHARRQVTLLIAGGARGADRLAEEWADSRGIPKMILPAEWDKHGKAAGMIRNRQILALKPDGVIAFPGGRGTADMVRISKAAGVKVWLPYG